MHDDILIEYTRHETTGERITQSFVPVVLSLFSSFFFFSFFHFFFFFLFFFQKKEKDLIRERPYLSV